MAIQIVTAGPEHLDTLVPLFDNYRIFYGCESDCPQVRAFLNDRLTRKDSVVFLAIDDPARSNHGLGFTQLYPSFSSVAMKPIWILNDLFVSDAARRSGVGRKLLQAAADFGSNSGAVRLELATGKDNLSAKALYESAGYGLDELFDHYSLKTG